MSSTLLRQHVLKNIRNHLPDLFHVTLAFDSSTVGHKNSLLTYPESLRDLYLTLKQFGDIVKEHHTYLNDDNKHENVIFLYSIREVDELLQMKMGIGSFKVTLLRHC